MHPSSHPGEREAIEHLRDLVQTTFAQRIAQGHAEAPALHLVAIDLGLSLRDCAEAANRPDLLEGVGDRWRLDWPEPV